MNYKHKSAREVINENIRQMRSSTYHQPNVQELLDRPKIPRIEYEPFDELMHPERFKRRD